MTLARDALGSIHSQISVLLLSNQLEHSNIVYPFATKENVKSVLSSGSEKGMGAFTQR